MANIKAGVKKTINKNKVSKQNIAYSAIKEAIIREKYEPAQMLSGRELCVDLGISRTPVMEALRRLAYEGFVELIPDKGIFVAPVKSIDLIELYQIREGIEGVAARLTAIKQPKAIIKKMNYYLKQGEKAYKTGEFSITIRNDNVFHELLISGAGNERMGNFMRPILEQCNRATYLSATDPERIERSYLQHRKILEAIMARDDKLAENSAKAHMYDLQKYMEKYYIKHNLRMFMH